ncbi:MAG: pyridoxal-phosphate dependent enzyme [Bacteroidales bacterium]|nr:pyridoxal-phosphate dependent enzyme [Bacteroidales bacterium]
MQLPELSDIIQSYKRINPFIHRTPVMTSKQINKIFGGELFFKCENFQKTGSFKFRGATNAVLQLNDKEKKQGVITHSSGNHAAALALAASTFGIKSFAVMPVNAPNVKKNAVKGYGAEIVFCEPTQKAREQTTLEIIDKNGTILIHPYSNFNVICGQGTASVEFLEQIPDLDIIITPVGGGGLLSGTATAVKGLNSHIKVFGAEPENANDAFISFTTGILHPSLSPNTVADGLLTSLCELTFTVIRRYVDWIYTVSEESIVECMRLIWERMKIIIEPSSAVTLAVIKENPELLIGKKAGLILSGGNVELGRLPFN